MNKYYLNMFAFGNVNQQQLSVLFAGLTSKSASKFIFSLSLVNLEKKAYSFKQIFHFDDPKNNIGANYYQFGILSNREKAMLYLIEKPLNNYLYNITD